jgi:hypothetical protein
MEWFEIIHIRSFSRKDREAVMQVFSELRVPDFKNAVADMKLLQDVLLETDLRIVIQWQGNLVAKTKSVLGMQLAAAFKEFGRIHHIVCRECKTDQRS